MFSVLKRLLFGVIVMSIVFFSMFIFVTAIIFVASAIGGLINNIFNIEIVNTGLFGACTIFTLLFCYVIGESLDQSKNEEDKN